MQGIFINEGVFVKGQCSWKSSYMNEEQQNQIIVFGNATRGVFFEKSRKKETFLSQAEAG